MKKLYTISFYVFFLITLTSTYTFAYVFSKSDSTRITLSQDNSGDHLVWISGCSFSPGSQGTMDAFFAMANWNNPKSAESVFRGDWVPCDLSQRHGRWSRTHYAGSLDDTSQILVTNQLQGKVIGQHRRTTNFATKKAVAFTLFVRPTYVAGEFSCDSDRGSSLKMTLTHELGHGLGLRHTQAKRWASMRAGLPNGYYCDNQTDQTMADIHPDDYAALTSAYVHYSILPQYRPFDRDLAALAYKNETDSFAYRSWISRAEIGNFATKLCPGDTIPELEFSVANRGDRILKYTRTFWSSPTTDLSSPDKSVLFWHSNRTKSPGARSGIFQGQQDLYFGNSDLPPVGDVWFMVQIHDVLDENNQPISEDRTDNNAMVHTFKIRRHQSCP